MSWTLGANKWASRLVIVLQFTAWSAVGLILLQKGITSLQNQSIAIKSTKQANVSNDERNLYVNDESLGDDVDEVWQQKSTKYQDDVASILFSRMRNLSRSMINRNDLESNSYDRSSKPERKERGTLEPFEDSKETKDRSGNYVLQNLSDRARNRLSNSLESGNVDRDSKARLDAISRKDYANSDERFNIVDQENSTKRSYNETKNSPPLSVLDERKRMRLSRLNKSGAAAAIAMVTVGAAMLVVGPAVIALRVLDERRQLRRFLKLTYQDDKPPSYEQATLMGEAPRYSTLSLNTVHCAQASTSGST